MTLFYHKAGSKVKTIPVSLFFSLFVNLGLSDVVNDKPVQYSPLFKKVEQPFVPNLHHTSDKLFLTSQITLVAASTTDVVSSWGKYERNPLLRSGDGSFGRRGLIVKSSLTTASLYALNKAPFFKRHRKLATIFSFSMSGILSGISAHNFLIQ